MGELEQAALAVKFMQALEAGDEQAVSQLFEQGFDPNIDLPAEAAAAGTVLLSYMRNWHGSRALRRYPAFLEAVLRAQPGIVRLMLSAGANASECIDEGGSARWSAIELACTSGNLEVVQAIAEHGGYSLSQERVGLLRTCGGGILACLSSHPQSKEVLQALLAEITRADFDTFSRAVPQLLAFGASLSGEEHPDSPLCKAISSKDPERVALLLASGASVTAKSQSCAMSRACSQGWAEGIRMLTAAGATVHESDIGSAVNSKVDEAVLAVLENCYLTGMSHRHMRLPRRGTFSPVVESVVKGSFIESARYLFEMLGEDPYQKTSTRASLLQIAHPKIKQVIASARTGSAIVASIGPSETAPAEGPSRIGSTGEPL